MIKIELTLQQAQQLAQLVEIAMKAGGVPNIRVGQPLYDIIEAAIINSQQTPKPE
jgi:hypothetical protein